MILGGSWPLADIVSNPLKTENKAKGIKGVSGGVTDEEAETIIYAEANASTIPSMASSIPPMSTFRWFSQH